MQQVQPSPQMQALIKHISKPQVATPTRPIVRVVGYMPIVPTGDRNKRLVRLVMGMQFPDSSLQYDLPLEIILEHLGTGMDGVSLKYPTQPLAIRDFPICFPWASIRLPCFTPTPDSNMLALAPEKTAALPMLFSKLSPPTQIRLFSFVEKVIEERERTNVVSPSGQTISSPVVVDVEIGKSKSQMTLRKRKMSDSELLNSPDSSSVMDTAK